MKINYEIKQVNSSFEDTAFFIRNTYKQKAFLFDCGRLGGLNNTEVLGIYDIFISHTHIDHFYGFDRILRGSLIADKTIRVFGPENIIKNVEGKLNSYTWNLIKSYPIVFEVIELSKSMVHKRAVYRASEGFEPEYSEIKHEDIDLGDRFSFDFEIFDHRVPSVGYRISEPEHIVVNKDKLTDSGYTPGAWLSDLKMHLRAGRKDEVLEIETKSDKLKKTTGELEAELISYYPAQTVTFCTDIAPTYENFQKLVRFAKDTDILLIEGVFLREDILHSIKKMHLTLDLSKLAADKANAKFVRFFHFAPRYDAQRQKFLDRLYEGFKGRII